MRPPILMYHAVASVERDPDALCAPPECFAQQLATYAGSGCTVSW